MILVSWAIQDDRDMRVIAAGTHEVAHDAYETAVRVANAMELAILSRPSLFPPPNPRIGNDGR
jgi:hypothetical protein